MLQDSLFDVTGFPDIKPVSRFRIEYVNKMSQKYRYSKGKLILFLLQYITTINTFVL